MVEIGGTRSLLGPQFNSKKRTPPAYGFGSGTREQQAKVFVSQEHAALQGSPDSPGPAVYKQRASVGPQVSGTKESAPLWTFGTEARLAAADRESGMSKYAVAVPGAGTYDAGVGVGERQPESKIATAPAFGMGSSTRANMEKVFVSQEQDLVRNFGRASPGPATFMLQPSVGKQVLSVKEVQPAWVLDTSKRFEKLTSSWVPAPGHYGNESLQGRIAPGVGPQIASTKPSQPRFGFGSSSRDDREKVYISKDHEASTGGRDAPGPGQYPIRPMTGNQITESRKRTSQSWGFGTTPRFRETFKQGGFYAPGPGAYVV